MKYTPSYILDNMVRESLPGNRKLPDYEGRITRILPLYHKEAILVFYFAMR